MADDDQFCLREGQPHDPHCVEDQGHWHCPGLPGSVDSELRASKQMHEEARVLLSKTLQERDRLRQHLADAPHDDECGYWQGTAAEYSHPCTCWKTEYDAAKEGATDAHQ